MTSEELREEGWRSIDARQLPPREEMVEFCRDERVWRQPPWFGRWADFDPAFNVAGLWWRHI